MKKSKIKKKFFDLVPILMVVLFIAILLLCFRFFGEFKLFD